jgi:hypothetical protein
MTLFSFGWPFNAVILIGMLFALDLGLWYWAESRQRRRS